MNKKGLTVVELLVTVVLFAFLITAVFPGLQSFFARLEMHTALRTVTAALSTARYTPSRKTSRCGSRLSPAACC